MADNMTTIATTATEESHVQILVVDDNREIHQDLAKLLASQADEDLSDQEAALFGVAAQSQAHGAHGAFQLTSAYQGKEALERLVQANRAGRPFCMAFVDMRMPPGWDGLETIERLWQVQPDLEVVICTAYSDHSWREVVERLGRTDRFLVLKKPFDGIEARQLACSLAMKAKLRRAELEQKAALEAAVEVRTRELNEARRIAESANLAKSMFLANMSHELRTPLTAVLGYADLLLDQSIAEGERASHAAAIKRAGEHLLRIINQVLDLSKIDAGQLLVDDAVAALPRILRDAERIALPLAREKGIEFAIRLAKPIPSHVRTDAVRLSQILINLVANAIKFTDEGSVTVVADCAGAGDRLIIDIEDTGVGIEPLQVQQLFTPFTQIDMSVTRRHGGTGLGLSISRKLAQLLGGDVRLLRSRPGDGSTFRIELPLRRAAQAVDISSLDESPPETDLSQNPQLMLRCNILLAEDSPENQRFLTTVLRKAGAQVTLAANGREALELIAAAESAETPFDLLITDIQMPILDGFNLARELRGRGMNLPIIALTAHAMEEDRQRCFEAGCNDYASKPISRATLLDTCIRWLPKPAPSATDSVAIL